MWVPNYNFVFYFNTETYDFHTANAKDTVIPETPYDNINSAGVINCVDKEQFMLNAEKILKANGILVIYDFEITDMMIQSIVRNL